jgi:hypothetical protein
MVENLSFKAINLIICSEIKNEELGKHQILL